MIRVYTQLAQGQGWLKQYRGRPPVLACILGFTATGLIPGISAAGATPEARKYTAIADAEFLVNGVTPQPQYPLPPLKAGASPVLISRAVVEAFNLPLYLFNAGLPHPPAVEAIDLGGVPANCLTSGNALPLETVKHLFEQGLKWGEQLAAAADGGYVIISECVVGGTTTALSVLTGLGIAASGKVNSSHPHCNHAQKWEIVQVGLEKWGRGLGRAEGAEVAGEADTVNFSLPASPHPRVPASFLPPSYPVDPFQLVAAVGDPMQIAAAGMAIAVSRYTGVLLAGGTQMLAVYALAQALVKRAGGAGKPGESFMPISSQEKAHLTSLDLHSDTTPAFKKDSLAWQPTQVVVGTTRWVAEDPTGDTVGLAQDIGSVPLLATQLSFAASGYPQLQAYEQGYVKEGVGAGGCAIAAHLYQNWNSVQLLQAIEGLIERYCQS
ncbi:MAG TPA: nicotinate-nucleotide--dimethylbenzimidazole phosphoribosyltransferase [Candidatus Sericytochromatia bacterium]